MLLCMTESAARRGAKPPGPADAMIEGDVAIFERQSRDEGHPKWNSRSFQEKCEGSHVLW